MQSSPPPGGGDTTLQRQRLRRCAGGDGSTTALAAAFDSISKQQTRLRVLAACFARALLHSSPSSWKEGAGKTGRRLAPMARCARKRTRNAQRENHRWAGNNPAFPAQWLYGVWRALPGDEFLLVTVASRIDGAALSVELTTPPRSLTVATTARTTRFCRTLQRRSYDTACKELTGFGSIRCPPCSSHPRRRCPRPPQPSPRFVTTYDRPFRGLGCFACTTKPNFGKVEYLC
jgi:hypothetical protein